MMFGRGYNGINGFDHGFMFGRDGMYGYMHNGIMMAVMALVAVALLVVIILVVRRKKHARPAIEAMEALRIRYAKGEITEDEFLRRKKVIE